jgi:hypothetical protein
VAIEEGAPESPGPGYSVVAAIKPLSCKSDVQKFAAQSADELKRGTEHERTLNRKTTSGTFPAS